MAFLRGHLNAESGLVLNEHSLKLLMLERCARGEKRTCGKGRKPSAEVSSWIYVCCVLTASLERINTPLCAGIIRWIVVFLFFFPIRQRGPRYGMDIQVLHSAQQNAVWSDPTYMFVFFFYYYYLRSKPRRISLSLRVEEGKWHQNATTSLRNKLVWLFTEKSTCLRTHGSHSDTQSSLHRLIWNDE